jgi:hypothetical protein
MNPKYFRRGINLTIARSLLAIGLSCLAASTALAQEAADNVVIVLDASGSMSAQLPGAGKDKMSAAKAALKEVLKSVPQETHIGLLVFSARGANTDWFYPLGPRDDAKLMQAIDRPMPGGNTPLGKYIKIGADRLLEERAKQFGYGTFRLLIVTDGEAEDKDLVDRYTPEIVARGITVDAIGVAMKERHTLATKVHSYRSANDPTSLKRAVAEVFAEVGGRGKDSYSGDAFAELQSIPNEVAQGMIQALSFSGNQPIGEKPRPKAEVNSTAPTPTPNAVSSPRQTQSSAPTVTRRSSGSRIILPIFGGISCSGIFFALLIFVIIRSIKRSRR